ncbi:hypothetical protein GCM10007086_18740 [Photobacterium aphoticum]|nr:hypothetical protein GCM10007086_18740 [Photobacterium aphoticum]
MGDFDFFWGVLVEEMGKEANTFLHRIGSKGTDRQIILIGYVSQCVILNVIEWSQNKRLSFSV